MCSIMEIEDKHVEIFCFNAGMDYSARPAPNTMPVSINGVKCSGRELSLLGCGFREAPSNSDHMNDIAVKCICKKVNCHCRS